jgi:uncharacterized membrane protein YtjA (UPF0391 family)
MLGWALVFLIVALVAGMLGFTGIAGASASMAKILFWVFLLVFLISLVLRGRPRDVWASASSRSEGRRGRTARGGDTCTA